MIDKILELNELKCDNSFNKGLIFIGHRKADFYKFDENLWINSYYDTNYNIFVAMPKKICIKELVLFEQKNYISSYILTYDVLEINNLEDYYNKNIKPLTGGIMDIIMNYKFSLLKKYNIIEVLMFGDNEEWVRDIKIEV